MSALGAALLVSGLFITLGSTDVEPAAGETPPIVTITRNPVVPRAIEVDAADWVQMVTTETAPAVARVRVETETSSRVGSAVVIRGDGYLLTSYDLVRDAEQINVSLPGEDSNHSASLLGTDKISGLAVIGVEDADFPTAVLGFLIPQPEVGAPAVALSGGAVPADLTMGAVSSDNATFPVADDRNLHGLLALGKPMPPGASGGALIDQSGAVVGIVVDVGSRNTTFAVPISYARQIAEDLMNYGDSRHPWMAIRGQDLDAQVAFDHGIDGGVLVTELVGNDGPAANAGLRLDDIIVGLEETPLWSMTDLVLSLRKHTPGETISITVLRGDTFIDIALTLGLRP